jgi:NAD+ synthase
MISLEKCLFAQEAIIRVMGVKPTINIEAEVKKRVNFLNMSATLANAKGFVLGISGGQDSFVAGMLAKRAAQDMGGIFVAMRLPYGVQKDEADAQAALDVIKPDEIITHNIKNEVDAMVAEYEFSTGTKLTDFLKGNDKARARMTAQYRVAGAKGLVVVGTDHAAEAITGFYTKFGDGACDIAPLSTLNKRQGRAMAAALGAPANILTKVPTADLLDEAPQQADETELGLTYDQIDDFLEGKDIGLEAANKLIERYNFTQHKRSAIFSI